MGGSPTDIEALLVDVTDAVLLTTSSFSRFMREWRPLFDPNYAPV